MVVKSIPPMKPLCVGQKEFYLLIIYLIFNTKKVHKFTLAILWYMNLTIITVESIRKSRYQIQKRITANTHEINVIDHFIDKLTYMSKFNDRLR